MITRVKELTEKMKIIESIRDYMHHLITEKGSLTDSEVVLVSQLLDSKLNEYNELVKYRLKM